MSGWPPYGSDLGLVLYSAGLEAVREGRNVEPADVVRALGAVPHGPLADLFRDLPLVDTNAVGSAPSRATPFAAAPTLGETTTKLILDASHLALRAASPRVGAVHVAMVLATSQEDAVRAAWREMGFEPADARRRLERSIGVRAMLQLRAPILPARDQRHRPGRWAINFVPLFAGLLALATDKRSASLGQAIVTLIAAGGALWLVPLVNELLISTVLRSAGDQIAVIRVGLIESDTHLGQRRGRLSDSLRFAVEIVVAAGIAGALAFVSVRAGAEREWRGVAPSLDFATAVAFAVLLRRLVQAADRRGKRSHRDPPIPATELDEPRSGV
jgi:hypothetical protein